MQVVVTDERPDSFDFFVRFQQIALGRLMAQPLHVFLRRLAEQLLEQANEIVLADVKPLCQRPIRMRQPEALLQIRSQFEQPLLIGGVGPALRLERETDERGQDQLHIAAAGERSGGTARVVGFGGLLQPSDELQWHRTVTTREEDAPVCGNRPVADPLLLVFPFLDDQLVLERDLHLVVQIEVKTEQTGVRRARQLDPVRDGRRQYEQIPREQREGGSFVLEMHPDAARVDVHQLAVVQAAQRAAGGRNALKFGIVNAWREFADVQRPSAGLLKCRRHLSHLFMKRKFTT